MNFVKKLKKLFCFNEQKAIGVGYLFFALFSGVIGSLLPFIIHLNAESVDPTLGSIAGQPFAKEYSLAMFCHGYFMICFMALPTIYCGFGNLALPLLLKIEHTAFPKINQFAFWLLCGSMILCIIGVLASIDHANFFIWFVFSFSFFAFSMLVTAVIFVTTIVTFPKIRTPLKEWPIFIWSIFLSSFFIMLYLPILLGSFVDQATALNAIKHQMIFWFFLHPENYIFLLLAIGILSEIVKAIKGLAARNIRNIIVAMNFFTVAGVLFWSQNILTLNMIERANYLSKMLAVFAIILFFIMIQLLPAFWQKVGKLAIPLYWVLASLFTLFVGFCLAFNYYYGLLKTDIPLDNSYFVGYFHYIIALSVVFAAFSGWYFWFPTLFHRSYSEKLAKIHFYSLFIGVNCLFLPSFLGIMAPKIMLYIGFVFIILSVFTFFYGLFRSFQKKSSLEHYSK